MGFIPLGNSVTEGDWIRLRQILQGIRLNYNSDVFDVSGDYEFTIKDIYLFNTGDTCDGILIVAAAVDSTPFIVRADASQSIDNPLIQLQKSDETAILDITANLTGDSIFIGVGTGAAITTGTNNVALGKNAGVGTTEGDNNVFLGYEAGFSNTTNNGSVFLGYQAGYNETAANVLYIANSNTATPLIWGDFNTANLRINGVLTVAVDANIRPFIIKADVSQSINIPLFQLQKSDATPILSITANLTGDSIFIGTGAGAAVTSGTNNTMVGKSAGASITDGIENTAVGWEALTVLTTGDYNTAIGRSTLQAIASGNNNTAIGYHACFNTFATGNTAIGVEALYTNTTNDNNVAIGYRALYTYDGANVVAIGAKALELATGQNNTGIGYQAGMAITSGISNTAVGHQALKTVSTNSYNTAVGDQALWLNTAVGGTAVGYLALGSNVAGASNTAMGYQALQQNNSGSNNTAVGYRAARKNTGTNNTAIGFLALFNNNADSTTAMGYQALYTNTTGVANTAIGYRALYLNLTGGINTAIGSNALRNNTGSSNTSVGFDALFTNTTGATNTAVGTRALRTNSTGDTNTVLGCEAGFSQTSSGSVFIGYQAGYNETSVDRLYIANSNTATPLIWGNFSTPELGIYGACKIGDDRTNYAGFKADGELNLHGTARIMRGTDIEIVIPAKGIGNPPADDKKDNFAFLRFDRATEEDVFTHWEIPHNYADAGTIHVHFDFIVENPPVTPNGDEVVVMGVEYKKVSPGERFDFGAGTSFGTIAETIAEDETTEIVHITGSVVLTTTGWVADDIILFRFYRDATNVADTYDNEASVADNDVWVSDFHIEYLSDKLGEAT